MRVYVCLHSERSYLKVHWLIMLTNGHKCKFFYTCSVDKTITLKQPQIIIISGLIIGSNVAETSRPKLNLGPQNITSFVKSSFVGIVAIFGNSITFFLLMHGWFSNVLVKSTPFYTKFSCMLMVLIGRTWRYTQSH